MQLLRIAVSVAVTMTVCLALFAAALILFQRRLIYFPRPLDREAARVARHEGSEFRLQRDGLTLHGWLLNPGRPTLLVYYGGNAEELSYTLDAFDALAGCSALLVNYRGFGESEGRPTEAALVGDALALLDATRAGYESVILIGRSLGTGIAVQVAAQRDCNGIVLVTPFDSITAVAQQLYPFLPVRHFLRDPYDSARWAPSIEPPALFLIAGADEIIDRRRSEALIEVWPEDRTVVVIDGATHDSIGSFPEYWLELTRFIETIAEP